MGKIEPGQHAGLLAELALQFAHDLGFKGRVDPDGFDRAFAAFELDIFREIDRAHATLADGAFDPEAVVEQGACCQHRVDCNQRAAVLRERWWHRRPGVG